MSEVRWTRDRLESLIAEFIEQDDDPARAKTRARILQAATELFSGQGYRKTSVDEIARRAGIAKGTIYLYYSTKGKLFGHVLALENRRHFDLYDPLFRGEVPESERLRFVVRTQFRVAKEFPHLIQWGKDDGEMRAVLADLDPGLMERNLEQNRQMFMDLIEAGAPGLFTPEEKRARADGFIALSALPVMLLNEDRRAGRDYDALADTLTDMIVYGIVHRPPPRGED